MNFFEQLMELSESMYTEVNENTFKVITDQSNASKLRKLTETKGLWNTGNNLNIINNYYENNCIKNNNKIYFSYAKIFSIAIVKFISTFIDTKEDSSMSLGNSKNSKITTEPDVWTIKNTDKVLFGEKLYNFTIKRGQGNEFYDCDFMVNENSLKQIAIAIFKII